jgi:hypothetical protein
LLLYTTSHTLLEDYVVQETELHDLAIQRAALRPVLRALGTQLGHWTSCATGEYQREIDRTARSPEQLYTQRVLRLLAGEPVDIDNLRYNFGAWHIALVVTGSNAAETVRSLAKGLRRQLLSISPRTDTVWAWFAGTDALSPDRIERLLPATTAKAASLAIGNAGHGIEGWRLTHRQALAAMHIGLCTPQPVTCYANVALLAAVLRDKQFANSLVEIYLSPLDRPTRGTVSRETLRAYFAAGCNAATAAAALDLNRHTVERRLRAIEARLGRLLHTCHAEMEVALRLEALADNEIR